MTTPLINLRDLDPTTAQFVHAVLDGTHDSDLCRDAVAAATNLLAAVRRRDTRHIANVPVEQVHLTGEQWAELERVVSLVRSSHRAEREEW